MMKSYKLVLDGCRPFSTNSAYYKNRQLTRECRRWRQTIIEALSTTENLAAMRDFRESFDPSTQGISIALSFGMPENKLYKINKEISRLSMDLTNIEKLLVDVIFDPKFAERGEVDNLSLDDKYVIRLYSEKIARHNYKIVVELKAVSLIYLAREHKDG